MENTVKLLRYMGDDLAVAGAAWASTGGVTEAKRGRVSDLLQMLAENGHGTPFEHASFTFAVTSELASHVHVLKHRAGVSVNAASARYRELQDDRWYTPADWPQDIQDDYDEAMGALMTGYHRLVDHLVKAGLPRARAKESARFLRPYGAQIDYIVTMNFRALMHFHKLRASAHAQAEVRELAQGMVRAVMELPGSPFRYSLRAFGFTPP